MASTSGTSTTSTIKSDRIGRARYSSEYKAEVSVAYKKSGMSGPSFAQQCDIKYPTFASWITKAKSQNSAPVTKPSEQSLFIAEIGNLFSREGLSVSLPGGASVQFTTPDEVQLLGILLKALA
jgi:transposase-like protein